MEIKPRIYENTCFIKNNAFYIVTGNHLEEPQLGPLSRAFLKAFASRCPYILIDCTSLTGFCPGATRAIHYFLGTLPEKRLSLVLFGLKPELLMKLEENDLAGLLTICPTEVEALQYCAGC